MATGWGGFRAGPQKAEHVFSDLYFRFILSRTKPEIVEQKRRRRFDQRVEQTH